MVRQGPKEGLSSWGILQDRPEGYKVYYGTASRTYGPPIDVGNVTTCMVPGLTQGVTYYFAVTAYDPSYNESGYSDEVYGMVASAAPEIVSAPNVLTGPASGVSGDSYTLHNRWFCFKLERCCGIPIRLER